MTKMIAKISEQLAPLALPLEDLTPLEGNPRRGDVDAIAKSYEKFGQLKPIVVNEDYTILSGNHQFAAAKQLGWTHIAAVIATELDEVQGKAFALADNRVAELGHNDSQALLEMLKFINEQDGDLVALIGYSENELNWLESLNEKATTAPEPKEIDVDSMVRSFTHSCPKCGFEFSS